MSARPTVHRVTERAYERVAAIAQNDPRLTQLEHLDADRDWALLRMLDAMLAPLRQLDAVMGGQGDNEGWEVVMDVDTCPAEHLGWLAQFHGVQLRPGLSDQQQREWVRDGWGINRGTPAAIRAAVQTTLTGTRNVDIYERAGGAYRLLVTTWTSQTPDPAATESALRAAVPAGLVVTFETRVGQNYEKPAGWTYGNSRDAWPTYQQRKDAT